MATAWRGSPAPGPRTLWLPLGWPGMAWGTASLVLLGLLLTMSRDLSFYDSAELALAAVQGGLGHPPGQPLHTMLGWLLAHLPWLPPLFSLNLLSALPTALAVLPLFSLAEGLAGLPGGGGGSGASTAGGVHGTADGPRNGTNDGANRGASSGADRGGAAHRLPWALALALLLLCLHPILWENASRIEVYSLALLFALWGTARAAALLRRPLTSRAPRRGWLAVGVALGLSATANPVVATFAALALAPALVIALAQRRLSWWGAALAVLGGLFGLLPYLYVPLVAGRGPELFVWGSPVDREGLLRFFQGVDFAHNHRLGLGQVVAQAARWSVWLAGSGMLPPILLGLVAHLAWASRAGLGRGWAVLALGLALFFVGHNVVFFPDVADYNGYLALPVAVLGAGAAALPSRLLAAAGRRALLGGALLLVYAASLLLAPPVLTARSRQRDRAARTLGEGALATAPPGAVLLVESDHWVFPLLYLQEAEGQRPDVVILALGLASSSWFWEHLHRRHPELRTFSQHGPGGLSGRVARFLAANPGRTLLFESWSLAVELGLQPGCAATWLLRDASSCPAAARPDGPDGPDGPDDRLAAVVEAALAEVGTGSPTSDAVLARVARERGEALWRLGRAAAALRAFRAGIPAELLPPPQRFPSLEGLGSWQQPLPRWPGEHAIGHWSHNLALAALLLHTAGEEASARAYLAVLPGAR